MVTCCSMAFGSAVAASEGVLLIPLPPLGVKAFLRLSLVLFRLLFMLFDMLRSSLGISGLVASFCLEASTISTAGSAILMRKQKASFLTESTSK